MNFITLQRTLLAFTVAFTLVNACTHVEFSNQHVELNGIQKKIADLEKASGGRIGLSAINTADGTQVQYRADERFPFCSTFKVLVVSAILKKSETEIDLLKQRIIYNKKDVTESGYAPIAETNLGKGMTISELCEAALQYSDNAAVNILMKSLGGLEVVNIFARSIGDNTFRLDRWEPDLNSAIPGDLQDTSTASAMAKTLQQLVFGDVLAKSQREQLISWLKGNTTGEPRIRAGVPRNWVVGDKTGTGSYGTTKDIGVIWPEKGEPIIVAVYFTQSKKDASTRPDIIASSTRILINALTESNQNILKNVKGEESS